MLENQSDPEKKRKEYTLDVGLIPVPKQLRYDPAKPFRFSLLLNILFGFASTFTVANLYYFKMSYSFGVSYGDVSRIPTLLQAGYAVGLIFISPLGDLVRRRQLILFLVLCSSTLTIGLMATNNLEIFEIVSFLLGVVSITPQILIPLAGDLAPSDRRATAISVVLSGLTFGILIARVLSGVIAEFASWRVVYYMALSVQYLVLLSLYFFIPDYPAKNEGLTYWNVLYSTGKYAVTEPALIQGCLVMMASNACFTNFWVTLTFLLGGSPYHYSALVIGLFGLIGMGGVAAGPFLGRLIDRLVPWYSTLVSTLIWLVFQAIETGAGGVNIMAVIIVTFGLDFARQMQQVSITTTIFSISESARSRMNAAMALSVFVGQVMGTASGTKVFVDHGWRAASCLSMGWITWQILVCLSRGPHAERYTWFGYEGGLEAFRESTIDEKTADNEEKIIEDVDSKMLSIQGENQ